VGDELAVGQAEHFVRDVVEVQRLQHGSALPEERAPPSDDRAGSPIVVDDVVQDVPNLRQIDGLSGQKPLRCLRVAQDRRQRLAQLVGQCARQLPERGHAGQVREQLPLLLSLQLSLLALGEVDHHGSQQAPSIRSGGQDPYHVVHPHDTAVGGEHPVLQDVIAAIGRRLQAQLHGPVAIVGMNVIDPEARVGVPLLSRVAQDRLRASIDEDDLERLGVGVEDDGVERVDEVAKVLRRRLSFGPGGLLGREEAIVVERGGGSGEAVMLSTRRKSRSSRESRLTLSGMNTSPDQW
jgi:hypothetical protein